MFWSVLDEPRRLLLKKIVADPPLPNCYLAGGTAWALMRGHRNSEDFDWFTPDDFNPYVLSRTLAGLSRYSEVRVDATAPGTFHGRVEGIRLTWLHYPNPLMEPTVKPEELPGFELASATDLALMKWAALSDRGARKDFLDLYEFHRAGMELDALLPLLRKKFPAANVNVYHMVKSLAYFDDAERDPWPMMFNPTNWEELREYFRSLQNKMMHELDLLPQ